MLVRIFSAIKLSGSTLCIFDLYHLHWKSYAVRRIWHTASCKYPTRYRIPCEQVLHAVNRTCSWAKFICRCCHYINNDISFSHETFRFFGSPVFLDCNYFDSPHTQYAQFVWIEIIAAGRCRRLRSLYCSLLLLCISLLFYLNLIHGRLVVRSKTNSRDFVLWAYVVFSYVVFVYWWSEKTAWFSL